MDVRVDGTRTATSGEGHDMITPITRRDLRELLGGSWRGRMLDAEFLSRLYDLSALPSTDQRYGDMAGDIIQHTDANDDWAADWIFTDARLQLDDDTKLLRLLAETVHPEVLAGTRDAETSVATINALLLPDGVELFPAGSMSGRPVFSWRDTTPRRPPAGDFPASLIAGMSLILPTLTTSTGIDSMFEVEDFPSPLALATSKEEKVKAWLRAASAASDFDHWAGLGRVLAPIMDTDKGAQHEDTKERIREALAKRQITYLPGGLFTTAPQTSIASLPLSTPPPTAQWSEIGFGGFGIVYRAHDPRLDLEFALKVFQPYAGLTSNADARARFKREAGLLFRLRHENIVRVYDVGDLPDGRPFIKMEYFDGLSLEKARQHQGFTTEEVITIVGKLATAVEHAHLRTILHRDIKPSNALVSLDRSEVRLIDFGLGILVEEAISRARLTTTAQQMGGAYSAPELLEDSKCTDFSIDIYSLGAIWFWLHAGRSPKGAGIDEVIEQFELDHDLKTVMHNCLLASAKRPSATVLVLALREGLRRQRAATERHG